MSLLNPTSYFFRFRQPCNNLTHDPSESRTEWKIPPVTLTEHCTSSGWRFGCLSFFPRRDRQKPCSMYHTTYVPIEEASRRIRGHLIRMGWPAATLPNNYQWMQTGCSTEHRECPSPHAYEDRPRKLWIDSVCINQADIDEQSAQVAIMAQIFSQCVCCLVWLRRWRRPRATAAAVKAVLQDAREESDDFSSFFERTTDVTGRILLSQTGTSAQYSSKALQKFFRTSGCERLWVR